MKHTNIGLLQVLQHGNGPKTITHETTRISKTLDDVLTYHDHRITDDNILKHIECAPPAYQSIASLIMLYTKDDNIVFVKRSNTFRCLDKGELVTLTYSRFFQRVTSFIVARMKNLVLKRNDDVKQMMEDKRESTEIIEIEYKNDTHRIYNMSVLEKAECIDKIFARYKALYV